jgi:hypothetical protein
MRYIVTPSSCQRFVQKLAKEDVFCQQEKHIQEKMQPRHHGKVLETLSTPFQKVSSNMLSCMTSSFFTSLFFPWF